MNDEITRRDALKRSALASAFALTPMMMAAAQAPAAAEPTAAPAVLPDLQRTQQLMQGNQEVKWVFAGDSITHGARHLMGSRDYVQLFEERLRWELKQEASLVIKTASSGWRLKGLDEHLDWRVLQFAPQVVSIHVGMNDCSGGDETLADFRARYPQVIARIRAACNAAIILHTPNGIIAGLDPGREQHLEKFAVAIREVATETESILVDHFQGWKDYAATGENPFYLMNDAIHPNEFGHRYKAHALFRALGIYDAESAMCRMFVPR